MYSCKLGFAATWHTCTLTSYLKQWWLMTLGTSLISGYTFGMLFLWRQDWCDYCNNWVFALITVSNKLPPPFNRKSNPPLQSNICCQMEAHRMAKAIISFEWHFRNMPSMCNNNWPSPPLIGDCPISCCRVSFFFCWHLKLMFSPSVNVLSEKGGLMLLLDSYTFISRVELFQE